MASRRHRPSFPTSPRPGGPAGADDISHLTLIEVRDRLKRNERVLNQSGLFSPTPVSGSPLTSASTTASLVASAGGNGMSPRAGQGNAGLALPPAFSPPGVSPGSRAQSLGVAAGVGASSGSMNGSGQNSPTVPAIGIPGPSRSPAHLPNGAGNNGNGRYSTASTGTSPTTSVRDKLLAMRQALLAREAQLVMEQTQEGMEEMQLQEPATGDLGARRRSSALSAQQGFDVQPGLGTSGKRLALESMMERDKDLPKNSLILPMAQTFRLAAREIDAETAAQLSNLAIAHTQSSSPKPRRTRPPHASGGAGRYPTSPTSSRLPRTPRAGAGDEDEIERAQYLARLNSFMGHAGSDSDHSDEDGELAYGVGEGNGEDEDGGEEYFQDGLAAGAGLARGTASRGRKGVGMEPDGIFDLDDAEDDAPMGYPGDEDRLDLGLPRGRMGRGTGEEIDPDGEDDERFAEGNDDYQLSRGDGMEVDSRS